MNPQTIPQVFAGLDAATLQWLKHDNKDVMKAAMKALNKVITDPEQLCPAPEHILHAFKLCPWDKIRVVIIGQDPYPNRANAMGMSFSIPRDRRPIPPSLINIYKCLLEHKLIPSMPDHGDLTAWARQGVLLLNATLTTMIGVSNSHRDIWRGYVDQLISDISVKKAGVIFMLWGNDAAAKKQLIDTGRHHVFVWGHPSPLSTYNKTNNPKNFLKCDHFVRANKLLSPPITWHPDGAAPMMINDNDVDLGYEIDTAPAACAVAGADDDNIVVDGQVIARQPPPVSHAAAGTNSSTISKHRAKWTESDWNNLRQMLTANENMDIIVNKLQRSAGAISAAIIKLVTIGCVQRNCASDVLINEYNIKDKNLLDRIRRQVVTQIVSSAGTNNNDKIGRTLPCKTDVIPGDNNQGSLRLKGIGPSQRPETVALLAVKETSSVSVIIDDTDEIVVDGQILPCKTDMVTDTMSARKLACTDDADEIVVDGQILLPCKTDMVADTMSARKLACADDSLLPEVVSAPNLSKRGAKWTEDDWNILRQMLGAGEMFSTIANKLGRSSYAIISAVPKLVAMDCDERQCSSEVLIAEYNITNKTILELIQQNAKKPTPLLNVAPKLIEVNLAAAPLLNIPAGETIYVAVDGACLANGKENAAASWAYCVEYPGGSHANKGLVNIPPPATNNRGELLAFIHAAEFVLTHIPFHTKIIWVYDSEYSYNCLMKFGREWMFDRKKQKDKKNLDIILPGALIFESLVTSFDIQFIHVNSHQDEPATNTPEHTYWRLNNSVDHLCQSLVAETKK